MRWLALCVALTPAVAAADIVPKSVVIVGRAEPGGEWRDGPTEARLDAKPELAVVVVARDGKKTVYLAPPEVTPLVIGGKKVKERRDLPADIRVTWFRVEPNAWRVGELPAENGADTPYYSNVVTGGAKHGSWLGYDDITYFESEIEGGARIPASARPSEEEADRFDGLGTMRYKVAVEMGGVTLATPGADARDTFGILPTVHRVSLRRDDSYLGYLSAYFLVPEVFGSAGPGKNHQTDRFTGADCADVLVGALREQGHEVPYTNVASLPSYGDLVVEPAVLDEDSPPIGPVAVGDVIRIDYGGEHANHTPRSWDHVAVLWEDKSDPKGPKKGKADGMLDGHDIVVHMGHPRLVKEPLRRQLPARVDVIRWNEKKLAKKRATR